MILSIGILHGQGNSVQITLSPKEGDSRKYHITSASESFHEKGNYEAINSTEKDVLIKISGVNKDKINMTWIYDKITFTNSAPEFNPILHLMNTLNKNMIIEYVINAQGAIQDISNYDEIVLKAKQQIDEMIHQMGQDNNVDASLVETLKFKFEMILSSKELLNALILEDVYKFHELYGLPFKKDSKNLIPEKDMPTDSYTVEWISSDNNRCKLSGELVSSFSDKKGEKLYEFELPTYWLEYYSSKWQATAPMNISNSYTITLIGSQ